MSDLEVELERAKGLYDSAEENSDKIKLIELILVIEARIKEEEYKRKVMSGEE